MSIQIKRGMKKDLPQLKDGELAFCKDTKELYVGNNGNENVSVTKKIEDRLDAVDSQLEHITTIKLQDFEGNNDTEKLKNLINYVNENYLNKNCNILINGKDLTITEDIIISNWSKKKIEIISKVKFDNCNGFEFRWLHDSIVTIFDVEGDTTKSINELNQLSFDGLKFTNCNSNIIDIIKINGFRNGLILNGKDFSNDLIRGCYANKITFKSVSNCFNAINLMDDLANGWVNENNIYGGGIYAVNGIIQGNETQTIPTTNKFHNNKFYHVEFEQIYGGHAIIFYQGKNCIIQHPRFEGSGITGDSKYFIEYEGANCNVLDTSYYLIPTSKIQLNIKTGGSIIDGDIRNGISGTKIANKVIAVNGGYRYIDYSNEDSFNNAWNVDIQNNTIGLGMGDGVIIAKKDKGKVHKIVCSDVEYIKNTSLPNGFENFSTTSGSTSPNIHCYLTGENEVVVGGLLKNETRPKPNTIIFYLPPGFECNTKCEFVVSCEVDTGDVFTATVEIEWNQVRLRKFNNNSSSFTKLTRLCLNGIRFKQDISTVQ